MMDTCQSDILLDLTVNMENSMLLFIRLFLEPKNHTIALGSVTNTAIEVLLSSSFYNVCLNALLQMKFFILYDIARI